MSQLSGSSDPGVSVVILAAGQGTRMKSDLAKVLHPVGGKAMVMRAIETAQRVSERLPVLVIGHDSDAVRNTVGERAQFVHLPKIRRPPKKTPIRVRPNKPKHPTVGPKKRVGPKKSARPKKPPRPKKRR